MVWSEISYFSEHEWGRDPRRVRPELVKLLDRVRGRAGVPIRVHVAWDGSGHAPDSFHCKGMAVDFHFNGLCALEQFVLLCSFREVGGLGWYPYWNTPGWHVDIRPGARRVLWYRDESGRYRYGFRDVSEALRRSGSSGTRAPGGGL